MLSQSDRKPAPAPKPVVARDLVDRVRAERVARDAADVRILVLATEWADRHTIDAATGFPCTRSFLEREPGDGVDHGADPDALEWLGLPELRWDTAASFAAAVGMSTTGGKAYIRDALMLCCRMPLVWARVLAGEVPVWRARKIAQTVLSQHDDVIAHLDKTLAPIAGTIGSVLLERALDEAMLRLHAEEREIDQLEALDRRYATLLEQTINHTGIAEFVIRGDWCDVSAFDDAVAEVAAALAAAGCEESLDVRRSMAAGVLADPAGALALLAATSEPAEPETELKSKPDTTSVLVATPKRKVVLNLDLTPGHLAGLDPVICDVEGRAVLEQLVRTWCSRPDLTVTVRPIRHCGGCGDCDAAAHDEHIAGTHTHTYQPTARIRDTVTRRDRHCVFPHCTRPARACDLDHITPFDPTDPTRGPTRAENLAPLCRHHHRLKTHAGWTYTMLEPGTYLWADRYRQHFLTARHGTTDLTDLGRTQAT